MNKFLVSTLFLLGGFCTIAGLIAASSTAPTIISAQAQNDWPYCNEPPAFVPFFDPCPAGSHIDQECADKCGKAYQATMQSIMDHACDDSWQLYINLLVAIDDAATAEAACVAAGTSQYVCHARYKATLHKLDNEYGLARDKIAAGVARDAQKALNDYFDCLFACPCIENGEVR